MEIRVHGNSAQNTNVFKSLHSFTIVRKDHNCNLTLVNFVTFIKNFVSQKSKVEKSSLDSGRIWFICRHGPINIYSLHFWKWIKHEQKEMTLTELLFFSSRHLVTWTFWYLKELIQFFLEKVTEIKKMTKLVISSV